MTASIGHERAETLQALFKSNSSAAKILENFANRQRDRKVIEVDRLGEILPELPRGEIIEVLKRLDDLGFGQFLVGRRGAVSRFVWDVSMTSVGRAALGMGTVQAALEETEDDEEAPKTTTLRHEYRLRPDFTAHMELPENLSAREAARLAEFVKTLPFDV